MGPALLLGGALALGPPLTPGPSPPEPRAVEKVDRGQPSAAPADGPEPLNLTVTVPLPPPPAVAAAPAKAAPDRWPVMRSVQGSWLGVMLDDNRMSVSGWTEVSFTASSSARRDQLPMGFNFRADDFLLQQNWLRVERTVDQTASTP